MDCETFQQLIEQSTKSPSHQSAEYMDWCDHSHECKSCGEALMKYHVEERGVALSEFPCVHLAYYATNGCDKHEDEFCPDAIICKNETKNNFGIPINDGGGSYIVIRFCPWCGKQLNIND